MSAREGSTNPRLGRWQSLPLAPMKAEQALVCLAAAFDIAYFMGIRYVS